LQLNTPMQLLSRTSKWKWAAPLTFLGALLVFARLMNTNPPTNSAHTSPNDPDLYSNVLESQPELAAPEIAKLRLSTYGRVWKFVGQKQISKDEIELQFHVPVVVFTDILTVSLKRQDAETTVVNVESHSQIGKGDFGENRRHVKQMIKAIAEELNSL